MNAHGAHYVANADAKVQLFSVTSITFHCFFAKQSFRTYKSHFIFKHLHTKSQQTAIFSLFLCNFAVACDCSTTEHATPDINKKRNKNSCIPPFSVILSIAKYLFLQHIEILHFRSG